MKQQAEQSISTAARSTQKAALQSRTEVPASVAEIMARAEPSRSMAVILQPKAEQTGPGSAAEMTAQVEPSP